MTDRKHRRRVDRGFLLLTAGPTAILLGLGTTWFPEIRAVSYLWIWLLLHLGVVCLVLSLQSVIESVIVIVMACLVLAGVLFAGRDKLSDELTLLFTALLTSIACLPIAVGFAALLSKRRENADS